MTELTIPPDANEERAAELVREHVEVGDRVEVWGDERTGSDDPDHSGEVTALEPGGLELDGEPIREGGLRYDEIRSVARLEESDR